MDQKERFLRNPHITLDAKRMHQLGITHEDLETRDTLAGPAIELPDEEVPVHQEVVRRKKKKHDTEYTDQTELSVDRSAL